MKKNNFFTDISNYISYETGQPTHCYDAEKINGKLIFNELVIDEEFETCLIKINLSKRMRYLFKYRVINLAGVVEKNTSCSSKTMTVLVECAFLKPEAIIGNL